MRREGGKDSDTHTFCTSALWTLRCLVVLPHHFNGARSVKM